MTAREDINIINNVNYLLPTYVMLPTEATPTAVPVQKTSSASINSSIGIGRSST